MKPNFRFLLVAVAALAIGLVGGAAGGIAVSQKVLGSPVSQFATEAANDAFLLKSSASAAAPVREADDVVDALFARANRSVAIAAPHYDSLEPRIQQALAHAVRVLDEHPLARRELSGDVFAMFAREARHCIDAGGEGAVIAECARREIEKVRSAQCAGDSACLSSMNPVATSEHPASPNAQASR